MHVKSVALCALAIALNAVAIASASAGDMSIPPDVSPDIWWRAPPPLRFSWTGCHLGAHFGGAFTEDKFSGQAAAAVPVRPLTVVVQPPAPAPPIFSTQNQNIPSFALNSNSVSFPESGMLAGAQGGCDLQLSRNWVIGFDADVSGANMSGSSSQSQSGSFVGSPVPATTTVNSAGNLSVKTNFISTVTGRLGYSFERGYGLFYAKAGAAIVNNNYNFSGQVTVNSCNTFVIVQATGLGSCTGSNPAFTSPFNLNGSETRVGWTVGTGIEWAILSDWSVKLEYDYLDFGSHNIQFANSALVGANISVNQRINEVKLGVNYLFGR
jgi:outer membrane immunogenic protein